MLAAGLGERLRPLTETVPKPLLELGGRPLIHYPLLMLKRAGITEVAINVHHLADRVQSALGSGAGLGIRITWAPEPVLLGTGGPLHNLQTFFGDQPFVIANSDTVMDLDVARMIAFHRERGGLATLALTPLDRPDRFGRLEIDADGRIRRIRLLAKRTPVVVDDYPREPPKEVVGALTPYMYAGALIADPAIYQLAPKLPPWGLMSELLAPMVARALPAFGFVHRGYFRTVDDLPTYDSLKAEFAAAPPSLAYLESE